MVKWQRREEGIIAKDVDATAPAKNLAAKDINYIIKVNSFSEKWQLINYMKILKVQLVVVTDINGYVFFEVKGKTYAMNTAFKFVIIGLGAC